MTNAHIYQIDVAKDDIFTVSYGKNGRYDFFFDGDAGVLTLTDLKKDVTLFEGTVKELASRLTANEVQIEASPSLQSVLGIAPHKTETAF